MSCGCNLRKRLKKENIKTTKRDVYLDYNATTKPSVNVLAAAEKINRIYWGNPSSQNSRGVDVFNYIEEYIKKVLKIINIETENIYFDTSSSSIIKKICDLKSYKIISTEIEHNSLLDNSDTLISVDENGKMNLKELEKILDSGYKNHMIVYSPVNHETGNIQPIKDIYSLSIKHNIPVILDAVQTIQRLEISEWLPYCNGFYFSGHKIHGLQGSSLLITEKGLPIFNTKDNTVPFSLYDGTFNVPNSIALLEATICNIKSLSENLQLLRVLHNDALQIIEKLGESIIFESDSKGVPGIINISLPEVPLIEDLLMHLNRDGILVGRLSACTGDINAESHVLKAMGRSSNRSSKTVRISFGYDSKRDDFFRFTTSTKNYMTYNNIYKGL